MILPLPPFAPSVQSLTAEVEWNWLSSGGFGAQFTTKHELMTPASAAAQQERMCRVKQLVVSPHCTLHTPVGGYFYFWVGPLDPGVHAVIGTRVWFGEPTRCAMKMLP